MPPALLLLLLSCDEKGAAPLDTSNPPITDTAPGSFETAGDTAAGVDTDTLAPCSDGAVPLAIADPDPREAHADVLAIAKVAEDLTTFGASLYRQAAAPGGSNVLVSPLSVAGLLGMLALDAKGVTRAELDNVLAPTQTLGGWLANFRPYDTDIQAPPALRHGVVQHARALFHAPSAAPQQPWLGAANAQNIDVRVLDFAGDPARAREVVNLWVAERSACQLEALYDPEQIRSETLLVAVDTAVVLADWSSTLGNRALEPFMLADGSIAQVDMLSGAIEVGVGTVGSELVIRVPTRDPTVAFVLIVPDEPDGLAALTPLVQGPQLTAWLDPAAAPPAQRELHLPALAVRHRPDLPAVLEGMGLQSLGSGPQLGTLCKGCPFVGELVHEAALLTYEGGFRAVSGPATPPTGTAGGGPEPLRVDRPFLVVIHDVAAGVPLFIGGIENPRLP